MNNVASLHTADAGQHHNVSTPYYIGRLALQHFRNIETYILDDIEQPFVCLIGDNGVGKTNILEAISLLQAGKGLRKAAYKDMLNKNSTAPSWRLKANISHEDAQYDITVQASTDKKILLHDNAPVRSDFLQELGHIFWATPYHDRLLSESQTARRQFLDKVIAIFSHEHQKNIKQLERALRERAKIIYLQQDKKWQQTIEETIISLSSLIAVTRLHYCQHINDFLQHNTDFLPLCHYRVDGFFENDILEKGALDIENAYRDYLKQHQHDENLTQGVHRTQITMHNQAKNMDAQFCSTGEQKLLMLSFICAIVQLYIARTKQYPILLLDEITAHLDKKVCQQLFMFLQGIQCQCWMSGTDKNNFPFSNQQARFFYL